MAQVILNITDISAGLGNWTGSGTSPYINATDANYIYSTTKKGVSGALKFENTAVTGTINSVIIYCRAKSAVGGGDISPFEFSVDNGSSWAGSVNLINLNTTYETRNTGEQVTIYDTWDKINAAAVRLNKDNSTERVDVDHIYMVVDYSTAGLSIPNPFDTVTIEENTEFTFESIADVYDEVTIEEDVSLAQELVPNVFDEITVEEEVNSLLPIEISKYDEVSVEEDIAETFAGFIDVYSEATVEEGVDLAFELVTTVYDEISIEESVGLAPELVTSVYDEVSTEEYNPVSLPVTDLAVNVFDTTTVTENTIQAISIELKLQWQKDGGVWNDLSGSGEITWSATTDLVNGNPVTSGEVGCTPVSGTVYINGTEREGANNVLVALATGMYSESQWAIDLSGATDGSKYGFRLYDITNDVAVGTLLAEITLSLDLSINVFDGVTVEENVSLAQELVPFVFDSTTITEYNDLAFELVPSVFDVITVEEYTDLVFELVPSVFDSVGVSEDRTVTIIEAGLSINVFDTTTVTEYNDLAFELVPIVYDTVTVTESIDLAFELVPSVFDSITVVDEPTIAIGAAPDISINVFSATTVTEYIDLAFELAKSVFDTVGITESVDLALELVPSVFDTVTTVDSPAAVIEVPGVLLVTVSDTITVSENTDLAFELVLSVSDTITTVDSPSIFIEVVGDLYVSVFDSTSLSENVDLAFELVASIFDTVTLSESTEVKVSDLAASVSDDVSVTEYANTSCQLFISVSDSIGIAEVVSAHWDIYISVTDNAGITEYVNCRVYDVFLFINTVDLVSISESTDIDFDQFPLRITQEVWVTEYVNVELPVVKGMMVFGEDGLALETEVRGLGLTTECEGLGLSIDIRGQ